MRERSRASSSKSGASKYKHMYRCGVEGHKGVSFHFVVGLSNQLFVGSRGQRQRGEGYPLDMSQCAAHASKHNIDGPDLPYGFLGFSPGPRGFKGPPAKSSQAKKDDMRKNSGSALAPPRDPVIPEVAYKLN
ncbi:hypothetical protein EVAR_43089_1 [Eumeta japonica]|uniref:Uncharacterized protein n=1 Tax=Eumeta variegata TaxID=151549 RepID=A0A4C1WZ08_EUMVA|nr:hypothetical protein EVAR_43089_1 [Eumeta japonica]